MKVLQRERVETDSPRFSENISLRTFNDRSSLSSVESDRYTDESSSSVFDAISSTENCKRCSWQLMLASVFHVFFISLLCALSCVLYIYFGLISPFIFSLLYILFSFNCIYFSMASGPVRDITPYN